ncbi:8-amino-7-oxononanoate synthase [Salinimicrobium catena]|uniref:8-amino-7-oxononanoate synthase n=1 Tax=Salinimicrobium catena TaxID=390640 RepID=A0A1H5JD98_9FLAO|nr:8-amino-7-oxononanoate synthase [Salinimicrobium catena]SDK86716.1 8-amino-7-oxononanoate synthase [Salinimicrobium catena]SEE50424.1 8-amino-7-oxononanoate synthase [Salinimicrobium catena]
MHRFPLKLDKNLQLRKDANSFRKLGARERKIDLASNDYLGLTSSLSILEEVQRILKEKDLLKNGAGGSRLLTGNHLLYDLAETEVSDLFSSESALIFNSGYDANIGFFSSLPRRGDYIIYDELSHASIRDGIALSKAKAFKFKHNDLKDLEEKISRVKKDIFEGEIYVVTEAVFSMDGDMPDLNGLIEISEKYGCLPILDEAHAAGVIGENGKGSVTGLPLQEKIFARLVTFGKAFGAHGAAILGSNKLKDYLVNFSRSLIYTTAMPPHSVATIVAATRHLQGEGQQELEKLRSNIRFFTSEVIKNDLQERFIPSFSAIHSCIIPGNSEVKRIASALQAEGFDVKPILSPTVSEGKERLRFCLHSSNSEEELSAVVSLLARLIK